MFTVPHERKRMNGNAPRQSAAGPSQAPGRTATQLRPELSHKRGVFSATAAAASIENEEPAPLTRSQAARLIRLSLRQFQDAIRPLIPGVETTGKGKDLRFAAPAVVAAFVDYRLSQQKPAEVAADPLMASPDGSPALEQYRRLRVDVLTIERDRLLNRMVPRDELDPALASLARRLREATVTLRHEFGNDAAEIMTDAVDEWQRSIEQMFPADAAPPAPVDVAPATVGKDAT